ncbi:MAG: hypothetical protein Q9182_005574 [Xanthomendoza sp. 2 TL-2023]
MLGPSIYSDCSAFPPPPSLPAMAKICLILTGMQQQHLLEDFLEHQVLDEDLPMEKPKVQGILQNGHANYASLFYTEQHRVIPRQWDEGQHLELEEEGPLPLVIGRDLNAGSYGAVKEVGDPFSAARYAGKLQRISSEQRENEAAQRHLEEETKRLKPCGIEICDYCGQIMVLLMNSTRLGAKLQTNLDRIIGDGAEIIPDTPMESDFKEEGENGHGRKTDIFALGCVFLELIASLLEEKLPMDHKESREPHGNPQGIVCFPSEVQPFSEHITELQEWAQQHRSSDSTSDLAPLMDLAATMIARNPEGRPAINAVVETIATSGRKFFCEMCWQDHEKITLPGAPTQPSGPDPPPSPKDSLPQRMINRVNSASATGVYRRVNSGLGPRTRSRQSFG